MRVVQVVFATALLLLGATVVAAQDVTYDFDRAANFSAFKTYAWAAGTNLKDELNHKRIVAAIDAQLAAKGLVRVEPSANPDLLVAYHVAVDRDFRITGTGWGGPYRFGPRSGTATVDDVWTGTLAVEIAVAKTNMIVWRGLATKEIDQNANPEKRDRNITRATEKLFKHYPPKAL